MVKRWVYHDPFKNESWTNPVNPNEMGSLFPEKAVISQATTAIDGKALLFEGQAPPGPWSYSGVILRYEHYERLLYWSRKRNRITITDHYGRVIPVYLTKFEAIPPERWNTRLPWRHRFTMTALVLGEPSVPTEV